MIPTSLEIYDHNGGTKTIYPDTKTVHISKEFEGHTDININNIMMFMNRCYVMSVRGDTRGDDISASKDMFSLYKGALESDPFYKFHEWPIKFPISDLSKELPYMSGLVKMDETLPPKTMKFISGFHDVHLVE